MNLFSLLNSRSKPITIGMIGAGKFATMFFSFAAFTRLLFFDAHKNKSKVIKLYLMKAFLLI